jgi:hypothetical protein
MMARPMLVLAVDWTKWSAIGTLAAAVATFLVALVTLWLVIVTRGMVSASKKGLEDDWSREWAAQRPVVYPLASAEWARGEIPRKTVLPLKNGGRGPALNVTGTITAESGQKQYERAIIGGTIAAGDIFEARIEEPGIEDWATARGVLRYSDLATGEYEGGFSYSRGPGNELVLTVDDPGHTTPAERLARS